MSDFWIKIALYFNSKISEVEEGGGGGGGNSTPISTCVF